MSLLEGIEWYPYSLKGFDDFIRNISKVCQENAIELSACCEENVLYEKYNLSHAFCIDIELINKLFGKDLKI